MSPPDCPSREEVERFLSGQIRGAREEELCSHVERCPACQQLLEELIARNSAGDLSGFGRRDTLPAATEQFLEHLKHSPAPLDDAAPPAPFPEHRDGKEKNGSARGHEPPVALNIPAYEVLKELGRGGMGVVYKARQVGLDRMTALKTLLTGEQATLAERARFRTEAEAIAALQHPHIVQVYEVGEHGGVPFFSMEFLEGGSLKDELQGRPQPVRAAAELIETLARAIHFAHQRGIIHRDLKPANILLVERGGWSVEREKATLHAAPSTLHAKITDFGLAKRLDDIGQTQCGVVLGTPGYMAPEQAAGRQEAIGPAVDTYALGAILYELVTGRPPFLGESANETLTRVQLEEPLSPRRLQPRCPRDLETICLKCLEKKPDKRYASALDLAEDLHRFLTHQPIVARPPSALDCWRKFAWRNKGLVGSGAGIMAALLLGSIVSLLFALGAIQERTRANQNFEQAEAARAVALREVYRARVAAALMALAEHDYVEAEQDLDAAPIALRGWEWQHVATRLHEEAPHVLRLEPRYGKVLDLASSSHRALTLVRQEKGFALIDAYDASLVCELPAGETVQLARTRAGVLALIYRPGEPLLVVDETGTARATGAAFGPNFGLFAVDYEGKLLAAAWDAGETERRLEVHDLPSGELRFSLPYQGQLSSLTFSRDGRWLAASARDKVVRLWPVAPNASPLELRGHQGEVFGVAFRPDDKCLLSWGYGGTLRQWRLPGGQAIDVRQGHNGAIHTAAYSPDGQLIVSGGEDHTVRLWRAAGGEALADLPGQAAVVHWVEFNAEGDTFVSVASDRTIRTWPSPARTELRNLRDHTSYVYPVVYSPDGKWFASGGWDRVVRVWDAASLQPIAVLHGPRGFVASLAVSPDSRWLVGRAHDGRLRTWDMRTGALSVDAEDVQAPGFLPESVAACSESNRIAIGTLGQVVIFDLATGRELSRLSTVKGLVRQAVFSPDRRQLALAAREPLLSLVDSTSGRMLHVLNGPTESVHAVAFSSDGRRLVSAGDDMVVRLWDTATGELQAELRGHTEPIFAVVFHPDGSRVASAGRDRVIRIWSTMTGEELARLHGHMDYVYSLAFSPDGRTLVSGSGDHTVRVWDTVSQAERLRARKEFQSLRPEAERLVEHLAHKLHGPGQFMERTRSDASLSESMKQAIWHVVLERATAGEDHNEWHDAEK